MGVRVSPSARVKKPAPPGWLFYFPYLEAAAGFSVISLFARYESVDLPLAGPGWLAHRRSAVWPDIHLRNVRRATVA